MQPRTLGTTLHSRNVQARYARLANRREQRDFIDSEHVAGWFASTIVAGIITGVLSIPVRLLTGSTALHWIIIGIGATAPTIACIGYGFYRCGEWVRYRRTKEKRRRLLATEEIVSLEEYVLGVWISRSTGIDPDRADIEQFPEAVDMLGKLQAAHDSELTSPEKKHQLYEKICETIEETLAPVLAEHQALHAFQKQTDELKKDADVAEHNHRVDRLLSM